MFKKLTLLAMSVAALVVFALPAAAQANPIVTNGLGEDATEVTAEGANIKSTTEAGQLECSRVHLELTGGTGHYEGEGSAEGGFSGTTGPCKSSAGFPVDITSIDATVDLAGGGTGSADFTYTYTMTIPGNTQFCEFVASGVGVSYTKTSDKISIAGAMTGGGTSLCPKTGNIHGDFTVTSGGEAVSIH